MFLFSTKFNTGSPQFMVIHLTTVQIYDSLEKKSDL